MLFIITSDTQINLNIHLENPPVLYNKNIQYLEYNTIFYFGNEDTVMIWLSIPPYQVDDWEEELIVWLIHTESHFALMIILTKDLDDMTIYIIFIFRV